VESWNSGAERMFGYSAAEVVGKQSPAMRPETYAQLDDVLHRVLDQQETVEFESQRRRKDGVMLDVAITASPMYDAAGVRTAIAVTARDITEHKRLQQQLEKSEEYFRSLIQGSSDVVLVIDMSGMIVFAGGSQERIFQSKPEEVQGTIAASYIHPDDLSAAALRLSEIATKPRAD
jgi:PAS domain S-box-containing protein